MYARFILDRGHIDNAHVCGNPIICLHVTRLDFQLLVFNATFSNIQLYYGDQLKWWKKPDYPERTTDHGQATGKLYHMRLRVECTLFVIYNA
jgi:hypothetical protein